MFTPIVAASLLAALAVAAPASIEKRQVSSKITANNGQCLGFSGSTTIGDGTPIGLVDCSSSNAVTWVFNTQTPSSISPAGNTGFALDAGSNPGNNFNKLKLWQSYPGLAQQT